VVSMHSGALEAELLGTQNPEFDGDRQNRLLTFATSAQSLLLVHVPPELIIQAVRWWLARRDDSSHHPHQEAISENLRDWMELSRVVANHNAINAETARLAGLLPDGGAPLMGMRSWNAHADRVTADVLTDQRRAELRMRVAELGFADQWRRGRDLVAGPDDIDTIVRGSRAWGARRAALSDWEQLERRRPIGDEMQLSHAASLRRRDWRRTAALRLNLSSEVAGLFSWQSRPPSEAVTRAWVRLDPAYRSGFIDYRRQESERLRGGLPVRSPEPFETWQEADSGELLSRRSQRLESRLAALGLAARASEVAITVPIWREPDGVTLERAPSHSRLVLLGNAVLHEYHRLEREVTAIRYRAAWSGGSSTDSSEAAARFDRLESEVATMEWALRELDSVEASMRDLHSMRELRLPGGDVDPAMLESVRDDVLRLNGTPPRAAEVVAGAGGAWPIALDPPGLLTVEEALAVDRTLAGQATYPARTTGTDLVRMHGWPGRWPARPGSCRPPALLPR
jgi:hypothetical protein